VFRDKFHLTELIRIGYGYATVASRRLRLSTVSYGHSRFTTEEFEIFEHVENHATEKNETTEVLRSITETQGYIYGPVTGVLRLATEAQSFKPWRFRRRNRESGTGALHITDFQASIVFQGKIVTFNRGDGQNETTVSIDIDWVTSV